MKRSTIARTTLSVRLGLIVLVTAFCLYQFVLVKLRKSADLDRKIDQLSTEVETNLRVLKSARRLLEIERREHRDWEAKVLARIPTKPAVNEILGDLDEAAAETGLRLVHSSAGPEEELEGRSRPGEPDPSRFFRIPLEVEVTGAWSQVAAYLQRLRELPRETRFAGIDISRKEEFFPHCYARIELEAYHCRRENPLTPR